jgi:hypothetical protein
MKRDIYSRNLDVMNQITRGKWGTWPKHPAGSSYDKDYRIPEFEQTPSKVFEKFNDILMGK